MSEPLQFRAAWRERKFWKNVDKSRSECWEWTASLSDGYGSFYFGGIKQGAHRVSWQIHNGAISDGLCVLHKCDNRKCVNPSHLFLGTVGDNNSDRHQKGRSNGGRLVGISNPAAKLSEDQVVKIRKAYESRQGSQKGIGETFGVSAMIVNKIVNGKLWKHVQQTQ